MGLIKKQKLQKMNYHERIARAIVDSLPPNEAHDLEKIYEGLLDRSIHDLHKILKGTEGGYLRKQLGN